MTAAEAFAWWLLSWGVLTLVFIGIPAAIFYVVTSIYKNRRKR
jgi:hypothetical protein